VKEDKASWRFFFRWLKDRGLSGVKLVVGDKSLGMRGAANEIYSEARYQRCIVHFCRNVFSVVPRGKTALVVKMLKAIHTQERKAASMEKAAQVTEALKAMKLKEAAKKILGSIETTLR
jgi:transposase-like protein